MCDVCQMDPCVCSYLRDLMPGGRLSWLAPTALAMAATPRPHRNDEGSCPCVFCYADRTRAWDAWAAAEWDRHHRESKP